MIHVYLMGNKEFLECLAGLDSFRLTVLVWTIGMALYGISRHVTGKLQKSRNERR